MPRQTTCDAGKQHLVPVAPESMQKFLDGRNYRAMHAAVRRRPSIVIGAPGRIQIGLVRTFQVDVLNVDHQQRQLAPFQDRVGRFGRAMSHGALTRKLDVCPKLGSRVVDYSNVQHATSCRRRYEHQALHQLTL